MWRRHHQWRQESPKISNGDDGFALTIGCHVSSGLSGGISDGVDSGLLWRLVEERWVSCQTVLTWWYMRQLSTGCTGFNSAWHSHTDRHRTDKYLQGVKKVSCCTVIDISKARHCLVDNSYNVKYSIILWTVQDLKVRNATGNSICVVKYSMLHTFMTSYLRKLVHVCLAVIAFSHRIFKHKTIVT